MWSFVIGLSSTDTSFKGDDSQSLVSEGVEGEDEVVERNNQGCVTR